MEKSKSKDNHPIRERESPERYEDKKKKEKEEREEQVVKESTERKAKD